MTPPTRTECQNLSQPQAGEDPALAGRRKGHGHVALRSLRASPLCGLAGLEGLSLCSGADLAGGAAAAAGPQWQPQALTTMLRCLRRMTLLLLS